MAAPCQFDKLKILVGSEDVPDELIAFMLERAEAQILNYCNRQDLPEQFATAQIMLAAKYMERVDDLGSRSMSQGKRAVAFDDLIPPDMQAELNTFRKASVGYGV